MVSSLRWKGIDGSLLEAREDRTVSEDNGQGSRRYPGVELSVAPSLLRSLVTYDVTMIYWSTLASANAQMEVWQSTYRPSTLITRTTRGYASCSRDPNGLEWPDSEPVLELPPTDRAAVLVDRHHHRVESTDMSKRPPIELADTPQYTGGRPSPRKVA